LPARQIVAKYTDLANIRIDDEAAQSFEFIRQTRTICELTPQAVEACGASVAYTAVVELTARQGALESAAAAAAEALSAMRTALAAAEKSHAEALKSQATARTLHGKEKEDYDQVR